MLLRLLWGWGGGGVGVQERVSGKTHLDMEERDGGRPLLALPLGVTGRKDRDPEVLKLLPGEATDPTLLPL